MSNIPNGLRGAHQIIVEQREHIKQLEASIAKSLDHLLASLVTSAERSNGSAEKETL